MMAWLRFPMMKARRVGDHVDSDHHGLCVPENMEDSQKVSCFQQLIIPYEQFADRVDQLSKSQDSSKGERQKIQMFESVSSHARQNISLEYYVTRTWFKHIPEIVIVIALQQGFTARIVVHAQKRMQMQEVKMPKIVLRLLSGKGCHFEDCDNSLRIVGSHEMLNTAQVMSDSTLAGTTNSFSSMREKLV
ncbi:Uncharacterized protein F383_22160 [Gossypium arboreum]|uniref:Uncharacterized protein n=1 Tax=Gossypium arboreum TaxID=29729 RepID=A0A0B0MI90_GOSAR|nr:Uncharacterized protein F383_22160 [Gossypium arboreum]